MSNIQSITTRRAEHHITARRQALEMLDADLASDLLTIEVLDERSFAFEACAAAFCKYARRMTT
jgi:hypothetical protein